MAAAPPPLKRARTGLRPSQNSKHVLCPATERDTHKHTNNLQVHECSFIKWHVSAITALATTPSTRYLAVARSNATIELRDTTASHATVSVLYPEQIHESNNITAMAFSACGHYLFATYLLGVVEVLKLTPHGLCRHTTLRPGGGAIWDIAVGRSPTEHPRVAVACDDGRVRIITPDTSFADHDSGESLPADPVHYDVMLTEKSTPRVLSVSWSPPSAPADGCIVCGDAEGGIRWLSPSTGLSFGKGKIPVKRGEDVMIWTLQFVNDGREVVCGDSRGLATVWSSATNTMTAEVRIEGMRGALWSSVSVPDEAGTDFAIFGSAGGGIGGLKKASKDDSWTPLRGVQLHTHDVRSLCCFSNGVVFSGSLDSLIRTFTPSSLITKKSIKWIRPYTECVGQHPIQFCPDQGLIFARIGRSVEVWSLSEDANQPHLLLRMNIDSILGDLRSCAISKDCRTIALSAADSFKLYQIWDSDGQPIKSSSFGKVTPMEVSKTVLPLLNGCVDMSFGDGFLACLTHCRRRVVFLVDDSPHVTNLDNVGVRDPFLSRLCCSGHQAVVSDTQGNVYRCRLEKDNVDDGKPLKWVQIFSRQRATVDHVTAFAFSGSGQKLAISTVSRCIFVLDLKSNSRKQLDISKYSSSFIHCISFAESEKAVLASGPDFCGMCRIDVSKKRKNKDRNRGSRKDIFVLPYKDSIIGASIMGPSRIAVVRRTWQQVLSSLSDAIPKKVYGT